MKTYLEYINEDDEWKTIGGRHVLIDPDSGEIKSGNLKGTNVKNFKKLANPKKQKAIKKAFADNEEKLDKMFAPDSPQGKEIDKMKIGGFDLRSGHRAMYAEKAFVALTAGLDGDDLKKFQDEYNEAVDVFNDKETMDMAHEMDVMAMYKKTFDDEIKKKQDSIEDIKNNKYLAKKSSFKQTVKKLEQDIKDLEVKKEKFESCKERIRKAKTIFLKMAYRYNQYLRAYPEGSDEKE